MESARQSSQPPPTVDLVRADLAEMWITDHPKTDSPKSPVPLFDENYLDLEPVPTPCFRSSKLAKKDALTDMLADVLDPTPRRSKETRRGLEMEIDRSRNGSSKSSGDTNASHHVGSDENQSVLGNRDITGPLGQASLGKPARAACAPKPPSPEPVPETAISDFEFIDQDTAPSSPLSPAPKAHRQQDSAHKASTRPAAARRGSKKQRDKPETSPKSVTQASVRAKSKTRKRDDDPYDIDESSDEAENAQAKKRKTRASKPKKSQKASKSAPKVADSAVALSNRGHRKEKPPARRVRKPFQTEVLQEEHYEVVDPAGQDHHMEVDSSPLAKSQPTKTFAATERNIVDGPEMSIPASMIRTTKPLPDSAPPAPARPSLPAISDEPLLPTRPRQPNVILLSSDSSECGRTKDILPSTLPLFMARNSEPADPGDSLGVLNTPEPAISSALVWPEQNIRGPGNTSMSGDSPLSFHPTSLVKAAGNPKKQDTKHSILLAHHIHNVSSDKRLARDTDSPDTVSPPSSRNNQMRPEDMWKDAVEDNSPPEVLHRIVTLLHRSLKPREEVVRDIARDYEENALRLLENMSARHSEEQSASLIAIRKATGDAVSIFSDSVDDMRILINRLRDMDVTNSVDTRRQALSQKLEAVARLCQSRLNSNATGPDLIADDSVSEPEMANEKFDSLADSYRLKLSTAVRRSDDQVDETFGSLNSEVEEFIKRCLQGKGERIPQPAIQKKDAAKKSADEALEAFLDSMIGTLQEVPNENGTDKIGRSNDKNMNGAVNKDTVMVDLDLDLEFSDLEG